MSSIDRRPVDINPGLEFFLQSETEKSQQTDGRIKVSSGTDPCIRLIHPKTTNPPVLAHRSCGQTLQSVQKLN